MTGNQHARYWLTEEGSAALARARAEDVAGGGSVA